MSTLSFEPLVPPALWVLLAAAGVALGVWYGRGRPGAVSPRRWAAVLALTGGGFAAVLFILLNPTWVEPVRTPGGKPVLTVVVDATGSMTTPDAGGRTRYAAATRTARALAGRLGDRFDVHVALAGDAARPADLDTLDATEPAGQVTDLAAAVLAGVDQERPQGQAVVLLSDGIHNAGPTGRVLDAARVARATACPVYTHTLGGDAAVRDLAADLRAPKEIAFVGQKVTVPVVVRQHGLPGTDVTVSLTADGKTADRRRVRLADRETTEVRFEVTQSRPGVYRYEAAVEPHADEVTRANNTALLVLRVVDRPVRVLLLEGRPYWDAKFLVRAFSADASVELDSVVRVGEGRLMRRTLSRPTGAGGAPPGPGQEDWKIIPDLSAVLGGPDGLRSYQVVVLGRDTDGLLGDEAVTALQSWLSRDGGCLICSRGQPASQVSQRLGRILPVRWAPVAESRFGVRLTDRGRALRLIPPGEALSQLPTLAAGARPEQPKPLAVVLATAGPGDGEGEPVVTYQPYGAGRVVVIEGAGMWRWAFLPPQQQHDEVYGAMWHGLLRWLVSSADLLPGQKLALRGEKVRFGPAEPAAVTLLLRADAAGGPVPAVELRGDGITGARAVTPVALGDEPGTYRAVFGPLPEGRYQARVAGADPTAPTAGAAFEVRNLSDERLDLKARPDLMARVADESGGAVLGGDDPDDLARRLGEQWERTRSGQVRRVAAWDRWWVLTGVLTVWAAAWTLRRSAGLV